MVERLGCYPIAISLDTFVHTAQVTFQLSIRLHFHADARCSFNIIIGSRDQNCLVFVNFDHVIYFNAENER